MEPIAFDIETSGLGEGAVVTVAGLYGDNWTTLILNTDDRIVAQPQLRETVRENTDVTSNLVVVGSEEDLLEELNDVSDERVDVDDNYLTAYNGETWSGGFDLPFVRTACIRHDVGWPFEDMAYIDVFGYIDRVNTNDEQGLVEVYDYIIGDENCDPFDDSEEALEAFEAGNFSDLLLHNLADIERTYELVEVLSDYVPQSDMSMKNLETPNSASY
jgi:uncharacterized protein YprB with RNaseH-like and TPR domain